MFIYIFNHEDYTFTNKMPINMMFYSYDQLYYNINNAKTLRYINDCYGAHTSVLCTVPSNHAGTHAYSRWIRES